MLSNIDTMEQRRCALQAELDGHKSQTERNKLGQFATPTRLARDMLAYGLDQLPKEEIVRFFDPAIGTSSFYSALMATRRHRTIAWARGFEIDPHYGAPAQSLWKDDASLTITLGDFTLQTAPVDDTQRANLLICNPPYVRHHHLNGVDKVRLQEAARAASHVELSGLAGLYCYFIALAHCWMSKDGIAGWLIPGEFMDTNYGKALKTYLLREVTLTHIHRFDPNDAQFNDTLVSSTVIWFKKMFLLDCDLPEDEVKRNYPELWEYLQTRVHHVAPRYLCRSRRHWYVQERRPAAPIVCTYIGRSDHNGQPFRFLLNNSEATATNVYLMLYPKPLLANQLQRSADALRLLWLALNAIDKEILLSHGRVYGGGMHKLEPRELANVPADTLAAVVGLARKEPERQHGLSRTFAVEGLKHSNAGLLVASAK